MKTRKTAITALACASELAREARDAAFVVPGKTEGTFLCMAVTDPDCTDDSPKLAHLADRWHEKDEPFLAIFDADGSPEWIDAGFLPAAV